jgi:hypothetical protein
MAAWSATLGTSCSDGILNGTLSLNASPTSKAMPKLRAFPHVQYYLLGVDHKINGPPYAHSEYSQLFGSQWLKFLSQAASNSFSIVKALFEHEAFECARGSLLLNSAHILLKLLSTTWWIGPWVCRDSEGAIGAQFIRVADDVKFTKVFASRWCAQILQGRMKTYLYSYWVRAPAAGLESNSSDSKCCGLLEWSIR